MKKCSICQRPLNTRPELMDCGVIVWNAWLSAVIQTPSWLLRKFFEIVVAQKISVAINLSTRSRLSTHSYRRFGMPL